MDGLKKLYELWAFAPHVQLTGAGRAGLVVFLMNPCICYIDRHYIDQLLVCEFASLVDVKISKLSIKTKCLLYCLKLVFEEENN